MEHSGDDLPDFVGKFVLVAMARSADDTQLLQEAHFERQGGRLFLVGTIPPKVVPGFEGVRAAVAWDTVSQYVVLDSLKQFRDACILQQRERWQAKWRRPVSWLYGDG